jgi:protein phosphatase PTC2/3
MNTGKLPLADCEITPVSQNDNPVRQYLINNPLDNPDENEPLAPLLLGNYIPNTTVDKSKCSNKKNGIVRAYAANTNKGIIRNYNEDRVSIILNILKPLS